MTDWAGTITNGCIDGAQAPRFMIYGTRPSPDRGLDQLSVHGRVSRPSRSRWPYLDKPDLAMDQPVHARPHVQPISRDAGCAAIRADPQMAADRHATARTSPAA